MNFSDPSSFIKKGSIFAPEMLRVSQLNRLKQIGRIGMIEQVGGRTVVIIKVVPKIEGQSRQSHAAAGLPALG